MSKDLQLPLVHLQMLGVKYLQCLLKLVEVFEAVYHFT